MPTYIVKSLLSHNGKTYQPGASIDLSAEDAKVPHTLGVVLTEAEAQTVKIHNNAIIQDQNVLAQKDAEIEVLRAELAKAQGAVADKTADKPKA